MYYGFTISAIVILSVALTAYYIRYAQRNQLLDIPNHRSSHTRVTPRGGGVVFILLWVLVVLLLALLGLVPWRSVGVLLPGTLLVAMIGFCDDRRPLAARYRMLAYLGAAAASVVAMGGIDRLTLGADLYVPLSWAGSLFAIIAIVWSINLFNFMDGTDGIAAVEALFVLGVGGYFFWHAGGQGMALVVWSLAASVAGFLWWNRPPAKLFMGDVGSASLGFVVLVCALLGEKLYRIPAILWLLPYGVFIVDATLTLLRRVVAGQPWYEAHRSHAYQRLHQYGFSHAWLVKQLLWVNTLLSACAIIGYYHPALIPGLFLIALVLLCCLYGVVEKLNPMFTV